MKKILGWLQTVFLTLWVLFGIGNIGITPPPDTSSKHSEISKKTPLFLEYWKDIKMDLTGDVNLQIAKHYSHSSHESHYSHGSHGSHYSHRSGI